MEEEDGETGDPGIRWQRKYDKRRSTCTVCQRWSTRGKMEEDGDDGWRRPTTTSTRIENPLMSKRNILIMQFCASVTTFYHLSSPLFPLFSICVFHLCHPLTCNFIHPFPALGCTRVHLFPSCWVLFRKWRISFSRRESPKHMLCK